MGTAVVSLIAFIVVLGAAFTALGDLVGLSVTSSESLRSTWREAERVVDSKIRPTSVSTTVTLLIADISVVVENTGRLKYAEPDFNGWEVIIRYQDTLGDEYTERFTYSDVLLDGNWVLTEIYSDESTSTPEIYEPGIFNPLEEMVITARLQRILGIGTVNKVVIVPPEGGGGSIHFNG